MKNKKLIALGVSLIAIGILLLGGIFLFRDKNTATRFNSESEVKAMIKSIYKELGDNLPSLEFFNIRNSKEQVAAYTGLKDNSNVEFIVVSEPLMNAQAYSLVVLKVKDKAKIESMKQEIYDNIDMNKWLCVSAEKLYITNSDDVIFLVMASEEWAKPVYEEFKKYVDNNIGKELEKSGNFGFEIPGPVAVE